MSAWFTINGEQLIGIILSALIIYFTLLVFVKINGLRSLSKMSSHDFAVTIAIGSIIGTVVMQEEPAIMQGIVALGVLLLLQSLYSIWRLYRSDNVIENQPLLLMRGPEFLRDNMKQAKITENDIISKLRMSNVTNLDDVQAVIFETSGDITVLHSKASLDQRLLQGVRTEA